MAKIPPAALFALLLATATLPAAPEPDFNREIRPILSENCYHCHGPDAAARKAKLRLDLPGALESSDLRNELVARVDSHDPDDIMPPPESKRSLTKREKSLLNRWVDSGAEYQKHWAYIPPSKPDLPAAPNIHPIDHLLAPQIKASGLTPTPKADPATLIRRLSLDLTGLPPTPKEVEDFIADSSPAAYQKLITRFLASKRFGEKWARGWLDLARYADSNGFQADQLRDSWAYRDWVIDAFNADMPFDQFTIEQLAGDLLPDATLQQKIATGFHRTVTCNVEAGVDPEENRVNQVVDRVNTTGTVWLGTTLECAQCHDHKYDPFSMEDYYGIFAYFNNTPLEVDNGGKGVSYSFTGPKMPVPATPEEEQKRQRILTQIEYKEAALSEIVTGSKTQRAKWEADVLAATKSPIRWLVITPSKVTGTGGEDLEILKDGSVLASGNIPDTTTYTIETTTDLKAIRQFKVEALTHESIPGKGPGRGDSERSNFILSEFTATADGTPITFTRPVADFSQTGWEVAKALDGDPKTGWAIAPQFGKPHHATFATSEPIGDGSTTKLQFTLDQNYGRGRVLGCIRISASTSDPVLEVPADIAAIVQKPAKKRTKAETKKLDAHYASQNPTVAKAKAEIAQLQKQLGAIKSPTTLVMVEMEKPRETHIMTRGNYLSPAEKVAPAIPATFATQARNPSAAPNPQSAIRNPQSPNRLTFARWLVSKENPLTARVTVNRLWAELFGEGIVATQEDFGTQSSPPTHPELLDYLATEFVESGWSMKHVIHLIVSSDAYQRSSQIPADHLESDPKNLLYARGPRFRMSAEMVRDNALAISGLLSTKMGGKPIMPYQPPGLWRQVGRNEPKWIEAKDENRYRRGIYIVYRRAAPYPSFTNFDAPDRSACVVARPRTNTPLQALTLLNDPAYTEIALALAARILTDSPKPDALSRIRTAYQFVFSRPPNSAEETYLSSLVTERTTLAKSNPAGAANVVASASGHYAPPKSLGPIQLAVWYHLATILLNLDETVTRS